MQQQEESISAFFRRVGLQQEQLDLLSLQWYVATLGLLVSIERGVSYWYLKQIPSPFLFLTIGLGWVLVFMLLRYDWVKLSSVLIVLLLYAQSVELLHGSIFFTHYEEVISAVYALVACFFSYFLFSFVDDRSKKRVFHFLLIAVWVATLVFLTKKYLPVLVFASYFMIVWVDRLKENFLRRETDALQRVVALTSEVEALRMRLLQTEQTFSLQQKKIENQKELLERQYEDTLRRSNRIRFYSQVLWAMAHYKYVREGMWQEAVEYLLPTSAEAVSVTRISLWKWDEETNILHLIAAYEESSGKVSFEKEQVVLHSLSERIPQFLIEQHWCVEDVEGAAIPEDSAAFWDYLKRHNILSFMWLPVVRKDRLYGLLCFENQGQRRGWKPEDVLFARSVVDVLDMVSHAAERRAFQEEIKRQKEEIEKQNELLRRQQEEILEMNRRLEALVQERTRRLEIQNKQLAEYAFVNAHLLRGPLCNILGIIHILEQEENQKPEQLAIWLPLLREASNRLDEIVKKIAHFLDDKGYFDRYDLKPGDYHQF
jgi:hypothetical protein